MKILIQIFIILLCTYIGEHLSRLISYPIPGSIYGLFLLFLLLCLKIVKPVTLQEVGSWLRNNLIFFFVPLVVSLMTYTESLRTYWLEMSLIILATTIAVIIVSAWIAQKRENYDQ